MVSRSPALSPDAMLLALHAQRERFRAFAARRVGDDADDVVQQAFERAMLKLGTLRDHDRLEAWFFRLLRNAVADSLAAREQHQRDGVGELADLNDVPDQALAVCACALGLLATLRPIDVALIERVDLNDESLIEAAGALGITPNNAAVRLHRARKNVRDGLRRCCGMTSFRVAFDCSCEGDAKP